VRIIKVKIIKCSDRKLWYKKHFGEIYEVSREVISPDARFEAIPCYWLKENGKEFGIVRQEDVEIVGE
jgi:hypothetical protein